MIPILNHERHGVLKHLYIIYVLLYILPCAFIIFSRKQWTGKVLVPAAYKTSKALFYLFFYGKDF